MCVLAAALVAAGCGRAGTPPDEIVLLTEAPVTRLDPRFAFQVWEYKVSQLVAPGLMGLADRELGPTVGLAESLEVDDDLTYVARLRAAARFSDGSPVTAEDVKYTFDSVRDPLLGSPYRKTWDEHLAAVEVVDARTVRFRLKAPRAPFRTDLEIGIVSRRAALPFDDAVRAAARAHQRPPPIDPVREVVGAGPYRIAARGPDFVTLERSPYALLTPATAKLTVRVIRDDNARVLALMGGSADATLNSVTPLVLETIETNPKLDALYGPSASLTYLGFNLGHPILRDRRVRQAIALGIDRERMVKAKLRGRARIALTPLDTENQYFTPDVRRWPHDPAAARRLLDEAGFRDPDGSGPAPRFRLEWKTSSRADRIAYAHAMGRQLADIGIAIDVRPFELATFIDDLKKGNFQLFTLQFSDLVEPDNLRQMFHSDRIPAPENSYGGLNRFRFRNEEVDRALERGVAVRVREERRRHYDLVQRVVAEELPMLPLWHEDNVLVRRRQLEAPPPLKTGRLESLLLARKTPAPVRRTAVGP